MYLLCVILITIAAVLMCLIVLIQNSKGGGLASGFASSNQIMGVKKTTDFIEKATWSLAAFMVVVCIVATYAIPQATVAEESLIQQSVIENNEVSPAAVPDLSEPVAPAQGEQSKVYDKYIAIEEMINIPSIAVYGCLLPAWGVISVFWG